MHFKIILITTAQGTPEYFWFPQTAQGPLVHLNCSQWVGDASTRHYAALGSWCYSQELSRTWGSVSLLVVGYNNT